MSQDCNTRIQSQFIVDSVANLKSASGAFCHNNHIMSFAAQAGLADLFHNVPIEIIALFRNKHCCGANRKTHIKCKMAGISSHNLDHRAAFVRLHGIAKTIYRFHCCICRRIITDRIIRTDNVVIDCRRNADHGNALLGEFQQAAECTVAADCHNPVQAE